MTENTQDQIENFRNAALTAEFESNFRSAIDFYNTIICLNAMTPPDWVHYCYCLSHFGDSASALSLIQLIARQHPNEMFIQSNCAVLLYNHSNYGDAYRYFEKCFQDPSTPDDDKEAILSYAIMCLIYGPFDNSKLLSDTVQKWYTLKNKKPLHKKTNKRALNKKLHIAYVNNYFHNFVYHTTSLSVLQEHDTEKFDITCYNFAKIPQDHVLVFENGIKSKTVGLLSDEDIIQMIEDDGVDILIDMNGFDPSNRWNVYANHPAPIMASWYNVFSPMGGKMFDYIIMDETLCPSELHQYFQEKIAFLPCWMAMIPPSEAPNIAPSPGLSGQGITFGCFNRSVKINTTTLSLWKRILDAIPNSRLYLRNRSYSDEYCRERVEDLISESGIDREKVTIIGLTERHELLSSYSEIDILLDPFPFNGGITSLEAMWQGVPTITLEGKSWGARLGSVILTGANCTEWIARSEDEYVAIAVKLASDIEALDRTRQALRERLLASPIMDSAACARAMERLFETMAERYQAEHE